MVRENGTIEGGWSVLEGYTQRFWDSVERSTSLVLLSVSIYLFGVVLGAGIVAIYGTDVSGLAQFTSGSEQGLTTKVTVGNLLRQNVLVNSAAAGGGLFMAAPTIFVLLMNGFVTGLVLFVSEASVVARIALFVPHAALEYGAYCLSGAAALSFPVNTIRYLREEREKMFDTRDLHDAVILIVLSFVFIVVAAIVETFVTPSVYRFVT